MKIYRAKVEYNNGECNEWEAWREIHSDWYSVRELAEKQLPELQKILDVHNNHLAAYSSVEHIQYNSPIIEEVEIKDAITPIDIPWYVNKSELDSFSYLPYNGKFEITKKTIKSSGFDATIYITVDEQPFSCYIDFPYGKYESELKIKEEIDKSSKFYRYTPEARAKMLQVCKGFIDSMIPFLKEHFLEKGDNEPFSVKEERWNNELKELTEKFSLTLLDNANKEDESFYDEGYV